MTNKFPPMNPQMLEQMKKESETFIQMAKQMEKAENDSLKKLFAGMIKQNFLIEMKDEILHRPEMANLMVTQYDALNFSQESLMLGKDNLKFDVCKFITMFHFFNSLTLDDSKRALLHSDKEYRNKLANQVIEAIKLRNVALIYNSKQTIEAYYPLTYAIYSLRNYMFIEFDKKMKNKVFPKGKNGIFKSQLHYKMLNKIKAILVLIDNGLIEESFNSLRSLIELYMIYLALYDCDASVIERYSKYVEYQFEYQKTNNVPDEIISAVNDLKKKGSKISRVDYLNFGWLDSIVEYCYINVDERRYKLVDVAEYLNMKYGKIQKNIGSILYKYFRECSPMSHGFNGFLNFYSSKQAACEKVCYILSFLADDFIHNYDIALKLNDIDLLKYMNDIYDKQLEYDDIINNDKKLYESLNKLYINKIF